MCGIALARHEVSTIRIAMAYMVYG